MPNNKGQSVQLVMVSLILLAFGVGVLSYAQVQSLPTLLGETTNDMVLISESQTRASDIANHYIPLSAHYSVAEGTDEVASYEFGRDNDHFYNDNEELEDIIDEDEQDINTIANQEMDQYVNIINEDSELTRCDVQVPDKTVNARLNESSIRIMNPFTVDLNGFNLNYNFVSVECQEFGTISNDNVNNTYRQFSKFTESTNNRFYEMITLTAYGLGRLQEITEEHDEDDYTGSETVNTTDHFTCTYFDDPDEAENEAEDLAEDAAQNAADSFVEDTASTVQQEMIDGMQDEEVCIPFTDVCTEWPDYIQDLLDTHDFNIEVEVIDWQTFETVSEESTSSEMCGCSDWECTDSDYTYFGNDVLTPPSSECTHDDEIGGFDDPFCDNADFSHDGSGSCDLDVERPDACPDSDYSYSDGQCVNDDDPDDTQEPCRTDDDFSDNGFGFCVHDDEGDVDPECSSEVASHDGSGDCEFDGDRDEPTCGGTEYYSAESTYDWEVNRATWQTNVEDNDFEIPTSEEWKFLEVQKRYTRDYAWAN